MTSFEGTQVSINEEHIPVSLTDLDHFADRCFTRGLMAGIGWGLVLAVVANMAWRWV